MSEAFIHHLIKRGNISIGAAGNRYWRRMPEGYERDDEGRKHQALMALEEIVRFLAEEGWVAPAQPLKFWRGHAYYIEWQLDYSKEESRRIFEGEDEKLQNLCVLAVLHDDEEAYRVLDPIVWKLSKKALEDPGKIPGLDGVDL